MNKQEYITSWLKEYAEEYKFNGFVIGVSGGIDSAVTSTLCALTGLEVHTLLLPIHQAQDQTVRGHNHIQWLTSKFPNVTWETLALSKTFDELSWILPKDATPLALANSKARLRMTALYAVAQSYNLLVAGTGNKVEDYGIGFFTKYGDGGVDLSPIGDLTKTQVWQMGRELGINQEIIAATPTDGLHSDNRSDESQIGCSYPELEWAMEWHDKYSYLFERHSAFKKLTDREKQIITIYTDFHNRNSHKMSIPPVCKIPYDSEN